mmetsp:Transcript_16106/g.31538  ORF Transcript_16106/g.31538 Transcript_16106/m.31538 type:complete len:400 (+) Transcript_16106:85-1284(+)
MKSLIKSNNFPLHRYDYSPKLLLSRNVVRSVSVNKGRDDDPTHGDTGTLHQSNYNNNNPPSIVITGSLSGVKNVSKIVPPYNHHSFGNSGNHPRSNANYTTRNNARLLVSGPDASGIVASFSQLLFEHNCGIVDCASESSEKDYFFDGKNGDNNLDGRHFYQRILFDTTNMNVDRTVVEMEVLEICRRFGMESQLSWGDKRRNMAIFVSKYDHCLWEMLLRHRAGELPCNIEHIISNHDDLRPVADTFGVPYSVFPVTKETKSDQEQKQVQLLTEKNIDLVVLARYMQVLSPHFCNSYPNRIINIHHSFLPAFMGASPYHRAHERGVKLIGATAHYATVDLDEGPIIEQDITRVSHRDDVKDLVRKGRTLEKNVLVSAVKAHLEDRILVHKNKCIVFGE